MDTPGFGFALGYERTLLAMKNLGFEFEPSKSIDYFVACASADCRNEAFAIAMRLRNLGAKVELDYQDRSLKSQFKLADKFRSKFVVVVGPDELSNNEVIFRNMDTHEQNNVSIDKLAAFIEGKI